MTYAYDVNRVTISGTMFGGAEEWSVGFYYGEEGMGASNPTVQEATNIAARWQTYFTSAGASIANDYTTNQVKIANFGEDGKTLLDNVVYYNYPAPILGANAATQYPPQIALAVTLTSDLQRGLASKGRMYLPGVCHPVGDGGKIAAATRDAHATLLQAFFDGVNTDLGISGDVILASFGRQGTNPAPGVNKRVTGLKLGDVYDTQRRRRNGLVEQYATRVIA